MMELLIVLAGIFTGLLSGFFGIGGGTILVPILIFLGYQMKTAIGISVLQMLMASVFGSYLNSKNRLIDLKLIVPIGIGGFVGAIGSRFFVELVSNRILEVIFFIFLLYAFYRVLKGGNRESSSGAAAEVPVYVLFGIGAIIGFFAISIGVGGSLLLVPILVGFFNYDIKKAVATGLFFVIFSSLSGVINYAMAGTLEYFDAVVIGTSSLIGVKLGIYLGNRSSNVLRKRLLLIFYGLVAGYMGWRIFFLQ